MEAPDWEEEKAREWAAIRTPENRRAGGSVKSDECRYDLICRKRECRIGQDVRERILRRHRKFLRTDSLRKGQPAGSLQKRLVRNALIVNAVSGTNHGFLVAKDVPRIAHARREIAGAKACRQRATGNS